MMGKIITESNIVAIHNLSEVKSIVKSSLFST